MRIKTVLFLFGLFAVCFARSDRCIKENGEPLHVSFLFLPLRGHVNPILGLAQELAENGCYVTFPISANITSWVNKGGVTALPITLRPELNERDSMDISMRKEISSNRGGIMGIIESVSKAFTSDTIQMFTNIQAPILRFVVEENKAGTYQPDIIVTEKMCFLCDAAAHVIGVPIVNFQPSLIQDDAFHHFVPFHGSGFPSKMSTSQRLLNMFFKAVSMHVMMPLFVGGPSEIIYERLNITDKVPVYGPFSRRDSYEIVATCFGFEYAKPLLPLYKLVGPLVPKEVVPLQEEIRTWVESEESDVVFMSMGTVAAMNGEIASKLVNAMGNKPYRVLWSLAENQRDSLDNIELPSNFKLATYVAQRKLLQHPQVKGFLSHTGASSSNEAMLAHVPVVCMPFFGDQFDYCTRIVAFGAGFYLDKKQLDENDIATKINSILNDPEVIDAARRAGEVLQCGGVEAAAEVVFDMYENGCDYLIPASEQLSGWERGGWDVKLFEYFLVFSACLLLWGSLYCCKCCCIRVKNRYNKATTITGAPLKKQKQK